MDHWWTPRATIPINAAVATVARADGASAYGVAGDAPAGYDVSQASDTDLLHVFPVAIIVIAILLALVLLLRRRTTESSDADF